MPELVILDCDGVLVDSETISVAVLADFVRKAGVDFGEEQAYRLFLGRSMAAVEDALREEFALELNEAQLDAIRAETFRRFRNELKPMPGVVETLSRLKVRRCVASSSSLERIRLSLSLTGLLEMLEPHIYSASMVARGKPAPDLFLHAARGMGVRPEDCVVVEDSPAGIDAARRAGMRVFAFTGGSHVGHAGLAAELETLRPDLNFPTCGCCPTCSPRVGPPDGAVCLRRRCRDGERARRHRRPRGKMLGRAEHPILMHRPKADHAEHDFEDIWRAVCHAVRGALAKAGVGKESVAGISFDATCSIVVRGKDGGQVSVSVTGERRWDTIVWLDHRALAEADECTATGHRVLDYLGGVMSPEMASPKLMWLKRHMPESWNKAGYIFDLTDYPDIARVGLAGALAMHAGLQMDLSRA